jgi:hypothetical protein
MLSCTEKDIYNLRKGGVRDPSHTQGGRKNRRRRALLAGAAFQSASKVVVASNGATGRTHRRLLAQRLQEAAPGVAVEAFPWSARGSLIGIAA